jgi:hypothetical protein
MKVDPKQHPIVESKEEDSTVRSSSSPQWRFSIIALFYAMIGVFHLIEPFGGEHRVHCVCMFVMYAALAISGFMGVRH